MGWPEIREILAAVRAVCPVESIAIETQERALRVAQQAVAFLQGKPPVPENRVA